MPPTPPIPAGWLAEFEGAARRPLAQRWKYAFIKTYKPVLDDAPTAPSRRWPSIDSGAKKTSQAGSVTEGAKWAPRSNIAKSKGA
jgi:hypothetical protein